MTGLALDRCTPTCQRRRRSPLATWTARIATVLLLLSIGSAALWSRLPGRLGSAQAQETHEHASSRPTTIAPALAGLRVEWASDPVAPRPGQIVTLIYRVVDVATGRTVTDLPIVHERPMHLFVVSRDLEHFDHVHPEPAADGSYRVTLTPPAAGAYLLFDEFAHGEQAVLDRRELVVGESSTSAPDLAPDLSPQTVAGVTVAIDALAPIRAGQEVDLTFTLTEAGQPVTDLSLWLGAAAHVAIVAVDEAAFVHAHGEPASGTDDPAGHAGHGNHANHGNHDSHAPGTLGPRQVRIAHTFYAPGLYKVWAQFSRKGQIFTVAFVVEVV